MSRAKAPIRNVALFLQKYFDTIQKYIEPFSELYEKLDIDYGTIGYPEKNINCPSGSETSENP